MGDPLGGAMAVVSGGRALADRSVRSGLPRACHMVPEASRGRDGTLGTLGGASGRGACLCGGLAFRRLARGGATIDIAPFCPEIRRRIISNSS
jgi:hypothetical protein